MIDPQTKVIAQVIQERKNQDRQWGGPTHDDEHTMGQWVDFMAHQIDRMVEAGTNVQVDRNALIKIAALAVAAAESLDRKANEDQGNAGSCEGNPADPHTR